MKNYNSDLLNTNDEYLNATGCGLPPVCTVSKIVKGSRQSCKTVFGKKVCVNIPTVKTVANQSCVDAKARHKACINDPNRKKILDKIKDKVVTIKADVKKTVTKTNANIKKKVTKLKDKIGKIGQDFRNKFRGIMRKGILFNIKNNIHGTATRLYPAVAVDSDVAKRKYKKNHVTNSRRMYSDVLNQWKKLGGNESDLSNAIISGSSKKFLKAPYKSINGDDSYSLYQFYTPSHYNSLINVSSPMYYGADGMVDEEGFDEQEIGTEEEVPSQEEEVKGIRGFFAWLRGLFRKNQADGNPYADGTEEGSDFDYQVNSDSGNEPDESEANDSDINDLINTGYEDGAGTDSDASRGVENKDSDKILGMPKGVAIGVGIALALVGGFFIYKKFIAKK